MRTSGRRYWSTAAVLALSAVVASACGSGLSHEELVQANQGAFRSEPAAAPLPGEASSGAAGAVGAASTGAGPESGSTDIAGSQVAPAAGSAANAGLPVAGRPASGGSAGARPGATGSGAGAASAPGSRQPGLSGAPSPAPGGKSEVRLGSFGTQSGPLGGIVLPLVQGAKAWVADVNARGGLNGHPVRLVMADDGGDPNRAAALARRMVEQDKVQAFYAVHSPTAVQAALPFIEGAKIPIIGVCECNPVQDESPMVFHPGTGSKTGVYWSHLAPFLHYSKAKKLAVFYCREAQTCAGIKDGMKPLASSAGVQFVYETQVSLAQPDFTAEVLAARNAGAEGIVAVVDNASVIRIMRAAHRQNYNPVVSSQQATYEDRLLRDGGKDIEGVAVAANVAPYHSSPKLADYRAAMDRYVPGGVKSSFGAEMWATGKLIELLARQFPANPTSQNFLDGLYSLRNETVGGLFPPIAFRRDKGHGDTNQCILPVRVEGGKFVAASEDQWFCAPGWKPVQP